MSFISSRSQDHLTGIYSAVYLTLSPQAEQTQTQRITCSLIKSAYSRKKLSRVNSLLKLCHKILACRKGDFFPKENRSFLTREHYQAYIYECNQVRQNLILDKMNMNLGLQFFCQQITDTPPHSHPRHHRAGEFQTLFLESKQEFPPLLSKSAVLFLVPN